MGYKSGTKCLQLDPTKVIVLTVLCGFSLISCGPAVPIDMPLLGYPMSNSIDAKQDFFDGVYSECTEKNSIPCFKYKLFTFVDKVANKDEINLANGVTVIRTTPAKDGAPRAMDLNKIDLAKEDITNHLLSKAENFLNTRTLKIDLRGSDILNAVSRVGKSLDGFSGSENEIEEEESRKKGGGGGGKKKGKILGHLLMMMKMKLLGLIPIVLGVIALMAGKALLIAKIALLLSLILALKKLLASHQKSVTYEVVAHPHHSSEGHESYEHHGAGGDIGGGGGGYGSSGHGSGGWGRSSDVAQELAYKAFKPATSTS